MGNKYTRALKRLALDGALSPEAAERLINASAEDGGPGSGNFGHKGRPGQIGGSGKGEGSGSGGKESSSSKKSPYEGGTPEYNGSTPNLPSYGDGFSYKMPDLMKRLRYLGVERKGNKWVATKQGAKKNPEAKGLMNEFEDFEKVKKRGASARELGDSRLKARDWCETKAKELEKTDPEVAEGFKKWSKTITDWPDEAPSEWKSKIDTQKALSSISKQIKPDTLERYKHDLENEPQITKDLCDIANSIGADMTGLDYRIKRAGDNEKGVCRIEEKIEQDIEESIKKHEKDPSVKILTHQDCVDKFSDLIRYTQLCSGKQLKKNYDKTKSELEKKGYKLVKCKNTWDSYSLNKPYRGINCVFEKNGTKFELQFHTPQSLIAKEVQHPWYEEERSTTNPPTPERKRELQQKMYDNMQSLEAPDGVGNISPFP